MTQRELILRALRAAGQQGACLQDFADIDVTLPYTAHENADLVVAMRNALPELLKLVDEVERHRRWLEEERKPPTHSEVSMFVALAALVDPPIESQT